MHDGLHFNAFVASLTIFALILFYRKDVELNEETANQVRSAILFLDIGVWIANVLAAIGGLLLYNRHNLSCMLLKESKKINHMILLLLFYNVVQIFYLIRNCQSFTAFICYQNCMFNLSCTSEVCR